eukprot:g2289.t1
MYIQVASRLHFLESYFPTFIFEELENGLECITKTNDTRIQTTNVVDVHGDADLYYDDCHRQQLPFSGWLYYMLNASLSLSTIFFFVMLINLISQALLPTAAEMNVIRHISETIQKKKLQHEAVLYIQSIWRLSMELNNTAFRIMTPAQLAKYQVTLSVNERIRIMDRILSTKAGCFFSSRAKQIKINMKISLARWKLAKQKARHLTNIRWHVRDLLDDVNNLKIERWDLESKVTDTKVHIDKALSGVLQKVERIRSKFGID